jgi:gamma-glutamyltranspeptidase/glutathione hydrolase
MHGIGSAPGNWARRVLATAVACLLALPALSPAYRALAAESITAGSGLSLRPGHAAIASAHPLATAAGLEILAAGGNAFDAAVAVTAALAVVEPSGSGLTGGGYYLLHRASDGQEVVIDAREKAPLAATRDMFLDEHGEPVPRLSMGSALGAGIPGEPAAMAHLAEHYGRLPAARSLAPAIRLATRGFGLTPHLQQGLAGQREQFAATPDIARNFLRKGAVPPLGTNIRQPELGATLASLAHNGLRSFYSGELAQRLVKGVRAQGGIWSLEDLAAYREIERVPLVSHYRGARIVSAPPPSAGGVGLIEALNILSQFDVARASRVDREHLFIEASRRAHRDRAIYLGDPDFTPVPVARLTDSNYAAGLAASLHLGRATASAALPGVGAGAPAGPQTTHFSVIDAEGNRVAATITLNFGFGSGRMVAGTGLFLNDEMDDFSIKPGVPNGYGLVGAEANAIAPGKRMLSSMTPSFIEADDRVMIVGSPGGSFIMGMVLLATLDFMDGKSAAQIVSAPRIHHQYLPDVVRAEPGALTDADRAELERRGHTVEVGNRRWGNMQVIIWNRATDALEAAADPRGDGAGVVQ